MVLGLIMGEMMEEANWSRCHHCRDFTKLCCNVLNGLIVSFEVEELVHMLHQKTCIYCLVVLWDTYTGFMPCYLPIPSKD